MKCKRKLNINSLGAAICNVAVFKGMKEREFKDQIYISYSEEGVILEAMNQQEWERANSYVQNFLNNKKISLLAFGFEKQAYEELIIRGLKDYTRKMKEMGEECPYINIIHYQKLRKSCEYMDKQRYVEPLKDWERKNKKNPNFAFLIVEPASRFEQVKKNLLQFLLKRQVNLQQHKVNCLYFLLLFFNSSIKEQIKQNFQKTYIQLSIELNKNYKPDGNEQQFKIKIINYSNLKLDQLDYQVVSTNKHLSKLGLQFIPAKQIQAQIKKVKLFLPNSAINYHKENIASTTIFQQIHAKLVEQHGEDYCVIPFKKSEKEKYSAVIHKFVNAASQKNIQDLSQQIEKNILCSYEDIEILAELNPVGYDQRGYKMHKACINDCPFLLYEYQNIAVSELETFLMYIQQLKTYYCTYLVRFYGITIQYPNYDGKNGQIPAHMTLEQKIEGYTYYLIFDFHHRTIEQMLQNDMILDNFQIAQMVLQILYLINFLHTHEEPRSLGSLRINEMYWPLRIVLPYLKSNDQTLKKQEDVSTKGYFNSLGEGFEGDVKLMGQLMIFLMQSGQEDVKQTNDLDDHFSNVLQMMLKESKYQRITLSKCISTLEELLLID